MGCGRLVLLLLKYFLELNLDVLCLLVWITWPYHRTHFFWFSHARFTSLIQMGETVVHAYMHVGLASPTLLLLPVYWCQLVFSICANSILANKSRCVRGAGDEPVWIYKRLNNYAAPALDCDDVLVVAFLAYPTHKNASSSTPETSSLSGVGAAQLFYPLYIQNGL